MTDTLPRFYYGHRLLICIKGLQVWLCVVYTSIEATQSRTGGDDLKGTLAMQHGIVLGCAQAILPRRVRPPAGGPDFGRGGADLGLHRSAGLPMGSPGPGAWHPDRAHVALLQNLYRTAHLRRQSAALTPLRGVA